ncbi:MULTISPECIES: hypothetical protein [unclassified Caballeronia]|uniref:hypothetical protein n=1 Tax=unclassified Caballeronia TaxID=2646786 RepID=UPI0020293221|nr:MULTISPECIES: hypothetical protein [unclassified Caballeronia]
MNDDHQRFFDPRSLSSQRPRRMPLLAQLTIGLLTALVIVLLLLAITSASWAILHLIHTAP